MSTQENENRSSVDSGIDTGNCDFRGYLVFTLIGAGIGFAIWFICLIITAVVPTKYTEITDIDQYGYYTGTGADSFTNDYIDAFFPAEIEDNFTNVVYSYKAENADTYGFEAYLEFRITDDASFDQYVAQLKEKFVWQESLLCPGFMECRFEDVLDLDENDVAEGKDENSLFYIGIIQGKVRKILYAEEENTIIYWALAVYDGNAVGTNYLNAFFSRFGIDPLEYEKYADNEHHREPFVSEIPNRFVK